MTLFEAFAQRAVERGDQIALITEKSQLSYRDILDLVQLFDMELSARGLRPGQTILVVSPRGEICIPITLLASLRGLRIGFFSPAVAEAQGFDYDRVITPEPIGGLDPARQMVIEAGWFAALGTLPHIGFETLAGAGLEYVFQSGGSTGTPKLVLSKEAERMVGFRGPAGFGGLDLGRRRGLVTLNFGRGLAHTVTFATLLQGGSILSLTEDEKRMLSYIDLYRVDTLTTTPLLAARILALPGAHQYLNGLRDIRLVGALSAPGLIADLHEATGARVHTGYGAAEIGHVLTCVHDPAAPHPPGYLGRPISEAYEIILFDEAYRPISEVDGEGIIGMRQRGVTPRGYLGKNGEASDTIRDGYFFPGDIMRRDATGYYMVGRVKNIVNVGGNKFSLEAIALRVCEAFGLSQVAPVVVVDDKGIEALDICYADEVALEAGEVTAYLAPHFAGLEVRAVHRLASLPLTEAGKVDMPELRARLMAES